MSTRNAQDITVRGFRHIVFCPLLMRGQPASEAPDRTPDRKHEGMLQPWVTELTEGGLWTELSAAQIHPRFTYEQIVYFHPFVRDFLFGDGDSQSENRTTRVLSRTDVRAVEVELGKEQPAGTKIRLDVLRTELYLCKPCVAILVIEVTNPIRVGREQPPSLDELQDLTDQFRRLYPPFWRKNDPEPGLCLRSLTWLGENDQPLDIAKQLHERQVTNSPTGGEPIPRLLLDSPRDHFDAFTRVGGEPPLFAHWQWFFGNTIDIAQKQAHIHPSDGSPIRGLYVQQLLDERMPVMSYFAVDDPAEISTGDRDRLTFVDASGPDEYPYDEEFLRNDRPRHTYARFAHYQTHYFCSGYGFAMLGKNTDFFHTVLGDHFGRHYFCLGLIAHYQRAALLYFADELASSVKDLAGKTIGEELASPEFRKHVEQIQHRFLKFRSRSFFPEVSNQLQGRELFRMWFEALETERLFDLVDSTSERLTSVLAERESRQLARIATSAVPWLIGLAVAAALFSTRESLNVYRNYGNGIDWVFVGVVSFSLLMVLLSKIFFWEDFTIRRPIKSLKAWLEYMRNKYRRTPR